MVVDAGGGTTVCVWVCKPDMSLILTIDEDITTFSSQTTLHGRAFIQQMASVGMFPLRFNSCVSFYVLTLLPGLHLGGAEIDCSFVSYLEPQISQAYQKRLQQDPQLFAKFMGSIENLKRRFSGGEPRIMKLSNRKVHMNGTLVRGVMDPVVDKILQMASNSVAINSAEAGEQGRMIKVCLPLRISLLHGPITDGLPHVKTIFLVGGLTQCGYIGTKLRHELQALGNVTVVTLQAYTYVSNITPVAPTGCLTRC